MPLPLKKKHLFFVFLIIFVFVFSKPSFGVIEIKDEKFNLEGVTIQEKENYQETFNENVYDEPQINQPKFTNEMMKATIASLNDKLLGCVGNNCSSPAASRNSGVTQLIGNSIAALYIYPPASSATYLANLGENLGLVKPAYAQAGTGFLALNSILPIWAAFRNISYSFFVIIFVVLGFAIMFRVKISPQTVVSIQSAIPRIVITLLLITFSYLIAGLLIDLMYVLMGLTVVLLGGTGYTGIDTFELQKRYMEGSFFGVVGDVFETSFGVLWKPIISIGLIVGGLIGTHVGGLPGFLAGTTIASGLFTLIVAVILVYVLFKLLIELLKTYVSILLLVIFAPLQIALGALPGVEGFGSWIRNLVANLLVFPAVAAFLIITKILVNVDTSRLWQPPMTVAADMIAAFIGLGMLLLVSKVPEMVKDAFKIPPFKYGTAIGEAMGPAKTGGVAVFTRMQGTNSPLQKAIGRAGIFTLTGR